MYSALHVADYILEKAREEGRDLTSLKLIKLVFVSHGWMLGLYRKPLVVDWAEAWEYGPVYREIYNKTKHYKNSPVLHNLLRTKADFSPEAMDIMDNVYKKYSIYSGIQLSNMTHIPGSPWYNTRLGEVIHDNLIEEYYHKLLTDPVEQGLSS